MLHGLAGSSLERGREWRIVVMLPRMEPSAWVKVFQGRGSRCLLDSWAHDRKQISSP